MSTDSVSPLRGTSRARRLNRRKRTDFLERGIVQITGGQSMNGALVPGCNYADKRLRLMKRAAIRTTWLEAAGD